MSDFLYHTGTPAELAEWALTIRQDRTVLAVVYLTRADELGRQSMCLEVSP